MGPGWSDHVKKAHVVLAQTGSTRSNGHLELVRMALDRPLKPRPFMPPPLVTTKLNHKKECTEIDTTTDVSKTERNTSTTFTSTTDTTLFHSIDIEEEPPGKDITGDNQPFFFSIRDLLSPFTVSRPSSAETTAAFLPPGPDQC